MFKRMFRVAAALAVVMAAAPAALASVWCGENGVIRFSFAEGDSIVSTLACGPGAGGVTTVDVWVWLTDVEDVALDGEAVLGTGAFEYRLVVEGAEVFVGETTLAGPGFNVPQAAGDCMAGMNPDLRIRDGRVLLATHRLLFTEAPRNVRVSLKQEGIISCPTIPGCHGTGTWALWAGPRAANMLNYIFGAGCEPAWINPDGARAPEVLAGTSGWREVGVFQPR